MAGLRFKVGLTDAAKLTGKQRSTILRAIQAGRLSEHKDSHGRRRVDVAELERVYGPLRTPDAPAVAPQRRTVATPEALADALADELRAELQRERDRADRLEADARAWQQRYLTLADRVLLTDQRPARPAPDTPKPPPRSPGADHKPDAEASLVRRIEQAAEALGVLPDFLRIRR